MKETLERWGIPNGDMPSDIFRAMHRAVLNDQGYDYRFGKAFFRHSTFKVFEIQGHYEGDHSYPRDAVKQGYYESDHYPRDASRLDSNCRKRLKRRCGLARSGSSPTSRLSPKSQRSSPGRKDRSAPPSFVGWSGIQSGRCGAL